MKDKEVKVGQVWDYPRWDGDDTWGDRIAVIKSYPLGGWVVKSCRHTANPNSALNGEFALKDSVIIHGELLATYPTWQEAVNSKEFKGE